MVKAAVLGMSKIAGQSRVVIPKEVREKDADESLYGSEMAKGLCVMSHFLVAIEVIF